KYKQAGTESILSSCRVRSYPVARTQQSAQRYIPVEWLGIAEHEYNNHFEEDPETRAHRGSDENMRADLCVAPSACQYAIPGDDRVRPARAQLGFQRQIGEPQYRRSEEPIGHGLHEDVENRHVRHRMKRACP